MTCLDPPEELDAPACSHTSEESETRALKAAHQQAYRSPPSVLSTPPAAGSPRSAGEGQAEMAQDKGRPSVPPLRGVWASRAARQDQAASLNAETKREDTDAETESANQPQAETEGSSTTVAAAFLLSPPEAWGSPGEPCSQRQATQTEVPPGFLTPLPSESEEPGERGKEASRTEEVGKAPTVEADAREAGGSESPQASPDDERREGKNSEQEETEPPSSQEDQRVLSRTEKIAYESKLAGVSGPNNEACEASRSACGPSSVSPASPPPRSPSATLSYLTSPPPAASGASKVAVVGAKTHHEQAGKEDDGTKPKKLILLRRGDVALGPCSFSVSVKKKEDNDFASGISTNNGQTDGGRNEGAVRRANQPEDQTEDEETGGTRPQRVEGTGKTLEEREREYNELRARIFSTSQRESPSASPSTSSPFRTRLPRKNLTRSYHDHFDPEFMRSVIPPPGSFHLPPGYATDGRHAGFAWGTSSLPQHRSRVQEAQGLPCEVRDRGFAARSVRSGRRRSYLRPGAAFLGGGEGPASCSADMEVRRTWDLRVDRRGLVTGETRTQTEGVETPGSRPQSLEEQKSVQCHTDRGQA